MNFRSDIEKNIKRAAASGEPQWVGVGEKVELRVWRIEQFRVWPPIRNSPIIYHVIRFIILSYIGCSMAQSEIRTVSRRYMWIISKHVNINILVYLSYSTGDSYIVLNTYLKHKEDKKVTRNFSFYMRTICELTN